MNKLLTKSAYGGIMSVFQITNLEEENVMKKIVALVLVLILCLSMLAGCSKTGTCDACGKTDVKVKTATYAGESADLCESCYALFEAIKDYL